VVGGAAAVVAAVAGLDKTVDDAMMEF